MHKLPQSPFLRLRQLLAASILMFILTVDCNTGRTTLIKEQPRKNDSTSCNTIRKWWVNNGFEVSLLPKLSMKNESSLQVCGKTKTCCTPLIEDKLVSTSKVNLNRSLEDKFETLKQSFAAIIQKYDSFCTASIETSAKDLDSMFRKTYGRLYEQNSKIFSNLYNQLRAYYKGKNIDLSQLFTEFFQTLMQKMFVLLNFQYSLDDRYLQCVVGSINELKPFGDAPMKLSSQVKRAFVAARTFLQALIVGKDVISALSKIELSQSCVEAFTRMTSCPHCRGLNLKPCRNFCSNVMRGCLANHYELNKDWNDYIENMAKIMERLEGPFSLEGIIGPLNVKISDAIMNFQEHSASINTKVFSGCGQLTHKPNSDRSKRELRRNSQQVRNMKKRQVEDAMLAITQEAKENLLPSKDIFSTLVPFVCDSLIGKPPKVLPNGPVAEEKNCWNGTMRSKYITKLVDQGLLSQIDNVEVDVDSSTENFIVKQQSNNLKIISSKLTNSFNGLDVDWTPSDTERGSGGGDDDLEDSGSGGYDDDYDISFVSTTSSHGRFNHDDQFGGWSNFDPDRTTPPRIPPYYTKPPNNKPYFNSSASFCMPGLYHLLFTFLVSIFAVVCFAATV